MTGVLFSINFYAGVSIGCVSLLAGVWYLVDQRGSGLSQLYAQLK